MEVPVTLFDKSGEEAGEITSIAKHDQEDEYIGLALIRKKALEDSDSVFAKIDEKDSIEINPVDLPITE